MKRIALWLCLLAGSAAVGVYLFTTLGCACLDIFPERVYRFSAFNPLRDRAPELVAQRFLRDQGLGKCEPSDSALCAYVLNSRAVLDSRLVAREDTKTGVMLYYRVKARDSGPAFWGQAAIGVVSHPDGWKVTDYNAEY